MSLKYKAIHGWASGPEIWSGLKGHLPESDLQTTHLGFYDTAHIYKDPCDIVISHSLGFLWAVKYEQPPMLGYVVINGFTDFTQMATSQALQIMKKGLQKNMSVQLKHFCKRADMHCDETKNWNQGRLIDGLDWLNDWSVDIKSITKPLLVLAGAKDFICPVEQVAQQFPERLKNIEMHWHKEAGHALPVSHTDWCAEKIKKWTGRF